MLLKIKVDRTRITMREKKNMIEVKKKFPDY